MRNEECKVPTPKFYTRICGENVEVDAEAVGVASGDLKFELLAAPLTGEVYLWCNHPLSVHQDATNAVHFTIPK